MHMLRNLEALCYDGVLRIYNKESLDARNRSFLRPPKGADKLLKDAMKLHVIGMIFHACPDAVHLFAALPQLAGDSNLNIECMMRALKHDFGENGMLPKLHVQVTAKISLLQR